MILEEILNKSLAGFTLEMLYPTKTRPKNIRRWSEFTEHP